METLYELTKHNIRNRRIIDNMIPESDDSQMLKLFELLISEKQLSDKEAMFFIYGKPNSAAFSRLKFRMQELLVKSLVVYGLGTQVTDPSVDEGIRSYRLTLAAKILNERRSGKLAAELLEKSILRSIKYHLTEGVLNQSRMLVTYYGSAEYNNYKYAKYYDIQQKYLEIYKWEIIAENYYFDLQRMQLQSLANVTQATKDKAFIYVQELDKVTHVRSYSFNYNKYRVFAAYYEYTKDYESLDNLCDKAIVEFNSPGLRRGYAISHMQLLRIWTLIQLGKFDQSIKDGNKYRKGEIEGSNHWFFLAHYIIKACLYQGEYIKAANLISEVINYTRYEKLGESFKEIFYTALGYIHLIINTDLIPNPSLDVQNVPNFKLGKFLNTVPVFSKDKQGINVSILLMHIAFLLQRKDYDTIIDRIDSLKQYAYRYLRKDDSFRSNCMIKMIIQMARADFNPIRTERYTADLLRQLSEVRLAGSGENIEIEFIPFEVLWEIMVRALK